MFVPLLEGSIDIVVSIYSLDTIQLHLPLLWTFMLLINFVCYNLGIVPIKKICEYCNELDTGVCCFTKEILARLHHANVDYSYSVVRLAQWFPPELDNADITF